MKTRYTTRFLPEQKRILLWCYGFWFIACFLSITLASQAKGQTCEDILQERSQSQEQALICERISLEPLLRFIPFS